MNYRTWTILFGPDSAILPGIAGRTGDQDHFFLSIGEEL